MIFNHCFKARSLILAAALVSGQGLVTHASGQEHSFLVDLNSRTATKIGTLGGDYSIARDINDSGQVVGVSSTTDGSSHGFITGPDGMGMRDLGSLGGSYVVANGINNAGQVVGESKTGGSNYFDSRAFITALMEQE